MSGYGTDCFLGLSLNMFKPVLNGLDRFGYVWHVFARFYLGLDMFGYVYDSFENVMICY